MCPVANLPNLQHEHLLKERDIRDARLVDLGMYPISTRQTSAATSVNEALTQQGISVLCEEYFYYSIFKCCSVWSTAYVTNADVDMCTESQSMHTEQALHTKFLQQDFRDNILGTKLEGAAISTNVDISASSALFKQKIMRTTNIHSVCSQLWPTQTSHGQLCMDNVHISI